MVQLLSHRVAQSVIAMLSLAASSFAAGQVVLPGVVHRWAADGDAWDAVGGAHGDIIGEVGFADGVIGQAFNFAGGSIDFGPSAGNFSASDFTVCMWVRTDATAPRMAMISKRPECGAVSLWTIRQYDGHTRAGVIEEGVGGSFIAVVGSPLADGRWHHLAFRREGLEGRIFIDGAPDAVAEGTAVANVNNGASLIAGASVCQGIDQTQPFAGQMDEIQLYARSLTEAEILELFSSTCDVDLDSDNEVGFSDLLVLISQWGPCEPSCLGADLDSSGDVGFSDILLLIAEWGPCDD